MRVERGPRCQHHRRRGCTDHQQHHCEREQARLTNESAGLAKELRELRDEREAGRKIFEGQRRDLSGRKIAATADHPQIEKQLAEKRKGEPTFERRMPERADNISGFMLYSMARRYDEWPGERYSGSSARGAMKGWVAHGVARQELWPDGMKGASNLVDARAQDGQRTPGGT